MKTKMFLTKYEGYIYVVLRIVAGFLFLWHGSQKLFDYPPSGHTIPWDVLYIGGGVEFFGGLFVMTGFLTRWAAFFCSGEMAYAYWTVHGLHGVLPIVNHGEMAVLYCFLFLFILFRGPWIFSIDHLLEKRKQK